jgi:hypothetical protein
MFDQSSIRFMRLATAALLPRSRAIKANAALAWSLVREGYLPARNCSRGYRGDTAPYLASCWRSTRLTTTRPGAGSLSTAG